VWPDDWCGRMSGGTRYDTDSSVPSVCEKSSVKGDTVQFRARQSGTSHILPVGNELTWRSINNCISYCDRGRSVRTPSLSYNKTFPAVPCCSFTGTKPRRGTRNGPRNHCSQFQPCLDSFAMNF